MKKTVALLIACALFADVVRAAGPFTVNTTQDTHDANTGDGLAKDSNGNTSLRAALEQANASLGTTAINLPPGVYALTLGDLVVGTVANTTITIHGTGTAGNTVISNAVPGRMVFNVDYNVTPNVVFNMDNVTVTGGSENELDPDGFGGNGGAMLAGGSTSAPGNAVTLTSCVFINNYCSPASNAGATGGAISMTGGGSLTIQNCTFSGNAASKNAGSGAGGAIYFDAGFALGNVTIQNSTFSNNVARQGTAGAEGGAIYLAGGTNNTYTVSNNTFTGNSALGTGGGNGGGAIFLATGNLTANFNRITGNLVSAPTNGSGLHMLVGTSPPRSADVRDNWWGADGNPGTGPGDDTVFPANNSAGPPLNNQISFDPWIVLKTTVSPTTIIQGHFTTATASFLQTSSGGALTAGQIGVLIGLPVTWANAAHGGISGQVSSIQANGTATATFTAGTGSTDFGNNVGTIEAKVDNVTNGDTTATALITIYQPPTITSTNAVTFIADSNSTFTVTATAFPAAAFSEAGALPSGITLNSSTGVLGGTPGANTGGVYPITITATNLAGTNAQSFTLTVNQAPLITSGNNATFKVGTAGSFLVTATGYPQPSLIENGALPAEISFTNANGILAGTPAPGNGGIYSIVFVATNGVISNNIQNFTLTVNEAPTVNCPADIITNSPGGVCHPAVPFAATASGFPAPAISYQLSGSTIFSPTTFPLGTNHVTVTATNIAGTNTCGFTVVVVTSAPPVVAIAPLQFVFAGYTTNRHGVVHPYSNMISATLTWPAEASCFQLQSSTNPLGDWQPVFTGGSNTLNISVIPPPGTVFYRLATMPP